MRILLPLASSSSAILKASLALTASAASLFVIVPLVMMVLGYRINPGASQMAGEAAAAGDVRLCLKVFNYGILPLGPTSADTRRTCIYTYAELTKNPAACELLMPSSYGLSCVGAAEVGHLRCSLNNQGIVQGNGINVPIRDCLNGDENTRNNPCCRIAIVQSVRNLNDCSSLESTPAFLDDCHYQVAFKNHDPASCEPIQNPTLKSACIVQVKALREDPSICQGCIPPVESIEDLK